MSVKSLNQKTFNQILESLLPKGTKSLAVAVSGGADSLALTLLAAEWAKAKNRNFPSPSCNLPPGFCETTVLSMIARCIPSPNHRRLASSANTLFFTHLDSVFSSVQFSNPFLPIASKRKGENAFKL